MMRLANIWLFLSLIGTLTACQNTPKNQQSKSTVPTFNADSAYLFVQRQVDFGPRVPDTKPHADCADFLAETLQRFGAEVEIQQGEKKIFSGETKPLKNIIGRYNSTAKNRILLCAHWDSRPYADRETDSKKQQTPILGANDGASGVGVLLEVARQLAQQRPTVGIDIVFFDLEDWGTPEFYTGNAPQDSWCLGSQFWAEEAKKSGYKANFGILLDMVGAPNARFFREQISNHYAANVVDNVWKTAQALGFGNLFVNERGGAVTDDHYYVNTIAQIPCIDIIQYNPYSETGFGDYWHTLDDTMANINRQTLYAVGQTLLQMIYNY